MKETILKEYKAQESTFDAFRKSITDLLAKLIDESAFPIHQLDSRIKEFESLSRKIDSKEGKYINLADITDIIGIRIITYLDSDVDLIANLIKNEFELDIENSIDKRILKIDQFGYKSLHSVVSINSKRSELPEYKQFKGIKCEIQIRSILQHAWAEIEHDLGYKGKSAIPDEYARRFNRLAALLETADIEFDSLKKELSQYEILVKKQIKEKPEDVSINQASLISFISSNKTIAKTMEVMHKLSKSNFYNVTNFEDIISKFQLFNIRTIKELEDSMIENEELFLRFVKEFIGDSIHHNLPTSVPLFYYQHFLASKTENVSFVRAYFTFGESVINGRSDRFIETFKRAKSQVK